MSQRVKTSTNYKTNETLPDTYRVQRLKHKPKSEWHAKLSQVFGGGMLGLSEDAWKLCQGIFDFDHMGNAEYEFGAIPRALGNIVQERAEFEAWSFIIKSTDVKIGWWRERAFDTFRRAEIREAKKKGEKPPRMSPKHKKELVEKAGVPIPDQTIYVASNKNQDRGLVEKLIRMVANGKMTTKGSPSFDLDREPGGYGTEFIGWFDLDNEILWFSDKEVFENFAKTFEIGQKEEKAA